VLVLRSREPASGPLSWALDPTESLSHVHGCVQHILTRRGASSTASNPQAELSSVICWLRLLLHYIFIYSSPPYRCRFPHPLSGVRRAVMTRESHIMQKIHRPAWRNMTALPSNRVLLETTIVTKPVKKFFCYGTRKLIIVFTQPVAGPCPYLISHPVSLRSILILSFHVVIAGFVTKTSYALLIRRPCLVCFLFIVYLMSLPIAQTVWHPCYMPCPSHQQFVLPNFIWWRVPLVKFLSVQASVALLLSAS
jgi:hypothetical protein